MNTAGTTASPTADAARDVGHVRSFAPARFMFAVDAVTAGALGAGMLGAPEPVGKLLFGAAQDPLAARMVGAVWTGFAAVSVAGVRAPDRYLPLFLAQAAYKSLWLLTCLPSLRARPAAAGMAGSFVIYVAGYALALTCAGWPSRRRRHCDR
jgi:hypothetical protein